MSRIFIVTGFLGAGKTTFLKNFIPLFADGSIRIIVNEFGKVGIDGELLRNSGAALDEINNGSIFCSCRFGDFERVLSGILAQNIDTILVETSGLTDTTGVKRILTENEKFSSLEYGGCICLVDLPRFSKVYKTATVVKKQINTSDIFILNKTDLVDQAEIDKVEKTLLIHRPYAKILKTQYGVIPEGWRDTLTSPKLSDETKSFNTMDITLRKFEIVLRDTFSLDTLHRFISMFIEDTYRIKGFITTCGDTYQVDGVGPSLSIVPYSGKPSDNNVLVVLSGNGLPTKSSITEATKWYPNIVDHIFEGSDNEELR